MIQLNKEFEALKVCSVLAFFFLSHSYFQEQISNATSLVEDESSFSSFFTKGM